MATSQTVKLNLDTREFDRGIGRATAALGALVSAATIGKIVQTTARFQDLQSSLTAVFGSAQKGEQAFKNIQDLSTKTQFSVEDLSSTFIKLASSGIQPTQELLATFTDAAAVTTDQIGVLNAMTEVYTRTLASGTVELQEFDKLQDRGLPVYDILKEKLGVTRNELNKFSKQAGNAKIVLDTLAEGINERFGGATAARLQNLSTLMSNFSIALTNTAANIGAAFAPAFGALVEQTGNFIANSDTLVKVVGGGLSIAFETLGRIVQFVGDNMSIFGGIIVATTVALGARGLVRAATAAKVAILALNNVTKATIFGAIATAVIALIGYLSFENGLGKTFAQIKAVVDVLGKAFSRFGTYLSGVFAKVIDFIREKFNKFVDGIKSVYNFLADLIPGMDAVERATGNLGNSLKEKFGDALEYTTGKADEFKDAIVNAVPDGVIETIDNVSKAWTSTGAAIDEANRMLAKNGKQTNEWAKIQERTANATVGGATGDDKKLQKQAEKLQQQFDQLNQSLFTEEQAEQASFNSKLKILDEYYKGRTHFDQEYMRLRETLETNHQKKLKSITQAQTDEQLNIFKSGQLQQLDFSELSNDQMKDFAIGAGQEILGALAQQNKKAFEAQKALNIAQAIMNTATGASKALAQGGVFGPLLAGLVIAAGAVQIATIRSQKFQGRATGGLVQGNQPYVVGEAGPEMFVPSQTGTIIPNKNMNGGSKNVNVTFNIETIDATGFDELLTDRKSTITNIIRDAAFEKGERSPV